MSTQERNRETVTRFNKGFIEGGEMEVFREIIAPDFVNHSAPPGVPTGPEGVVYFFNHFLRPAFPDLRVEIHDQVAEGDRVTTRKSFHATHRGEFLGVPATGRRVTMNVIDILQLRDGQFIAHWGLLDMQGVMEQISSGEVVGAE